VQIINGFAPIIAAGAIMRVIDRRARFCIEKEIADGE